MLQKVRLGLIPLFLAFTFAFPFGAAAANPTVQTGQSSGLGTFLTDARGMTLYQYKKDPPNNSTCANACAAAWPPLVVTGTPSLAPGVSGRLGTITRADGKQQVTYNGIPLYGYAGDQNPGDTNGQGVGNVWSVVTAVSAATQSASLAAAPTPVDSSPSASAPAAPGALSQLPATGGFPLVPIVAGGAALLAIGLGLRRR